MYLQNSTLQAQNIWLEDYFEALWIKEACKDDPNTSNTNV